MEKTLAVIKRMKALGIIKDYAVGGGMAAMFYMEPVLTYDLDIFCVLSGTEKGLNILAPIYKWADQSGYKTFKEHLVIEGLPVQFIPAYNKLTEEAVEKAVEKKAGAVNTRVVSPEHLVAIMIQTGRKKDILKAGKMLAEAKINKRLLSAIISRHGLRAKSRAIGI